MEIKSIATFHSPFGSKFGIPKQSNVVASLQGTIVFEPEYRCADALRGLEGFDFLWLIWGFSANRHKAFSPVVRPPRLGGNEKVGVFASRSPYRPNPLRLSSVRLKRIEWESYNGPLIHVLGADLKDGTPIYDIKPYVPFADAHAEARSGFVDAHSWQTLRVVFSPAVEEYLRKEGMDTELLEQLRDVLAQDPRPHYHADPLRVYGMTFAGIDVHFRVEGQTLFVIP